MRCVLLSAAREAGLSWVYEIENLGERWRCVMVCGAEQAMWAAADAEMLLLLPGRESAQLLQAMAERPPLAPPFILGEGAPDGPLPRAADLPDVVRRWKEEGRLPALTARHLQQASDMACALLKTMEVPCRLKAWDFLPEMCALTVVHPALLHDLQHGLYPLIGKRFDLKTAAVERRLRLCVESTWTHGSLDALERFFGSSVDPEKGKPTNREFLCRMQERLTLTMHRLV